LANFIIYSKKKKAAILIRFAQQTHERNLQFFVFFASNIVLNIYNLTYIPLVDLDLQHQFL
jgi:hypothetical protein